MAAGRPAGVSPSVPFVSGRSQWVVADRSFVLTTFLIIVSFASGSENGMMKNV